MPGGFSVAIGSDTRLFEQGVKVGVIEPVEDAQEALQDLAKAGDKVSDGLDFRDGERDLDRLGKAGKDAGDDIEDGAKQADRALDKLGDAGKDAGKDLERGLKDAQDQTGKTSAEYKEMAEKIRAETAKIKAQSKDDFDGAGGATGEFKEEALANFSEVTSSFTGDMQSITDLAQGTFGGLASMGGPASLAFGGIAVAVGLIGSALSQSGEDADEFEQKIQDLANTRLGDLFDSFAESGNEVDAAVRDWAQNADDYGISLTDLKKNLEDSGTAYGDVAEAIAKQSLPMMRRQKDSIDDQISSLRRQAAEQRGAGNGVSALGKKFSEQADRLDTVSDALNQNIKVNKLADDTLRDVASAAGQTVEQWKAAQQATADYNESIESLADTMTSVLGEAAESTSEAIDNAASNPQKYIDGLNKRIEAAQQYRSNIQAIGAELPDDIMNFVRNQGEGFSQEIATYLTATPAQKAQIEAGWKIAAQVEGDTTDVDAKTAAKGKERTKGPTSELQGDTSDVDKKVTEKSRQKADGPTSKLRADTADVDDAIKRLKGKKVTGPTVVYQVDTTAVDNANRRIANSPVSQIVNQRIGKRVA